MKKNRQNAADELWREACILEDEGKIDAAINIYTRAANLGHAISQSNLGNLLDEKITPARSKEALYWYKRAAKSGFAPAAWNLAMHYRNKGRRRWYIHWLGVAAGLGDEEAQTELRSLINLLP